MFQPQVKNSKAKAAPAHARPYGTLAAIREFLDGFSPPSGSFDPRGSWKQSYAILLSSKGIGTVGYLEIEREASGDSITLSVESAVRQAGAVQHTKAKILCAADALATPKSWQLESVMLASSGQPFSATRLTHTATVAGNRIESQFGRHKRVTKVPRPFTSNWSLFDAVQRLSGKDALKFALLEDLDLFKPNQRLSFAEKTNVGVAGGRQLALSGYERIGEGVLPYHYWVDDQHRLLFVLSGSRAYFHDSEARGHMGTGGNPRRKG